MDDELVGTIPHALRRHQGPLPRPGRRATGWPPSLEQFLTIAGRVVERIERAGVPSGAKRLTVGDNGPGGVPGPELRLTANGARARAISRRIGGAQRRFTIEGSARMGLADARRAAVALRARSMPARRRPPSVAPRAPGQRSCGSASAGRGRWAS